MDGFTFAWLMDSLAESPGTAFYREEIPVVKYSELDWETVRSHLRAVTTNMGG